MATYRVVTTTRVTRAYLIEAESEHDAIMDFDMDRSRLVSEDIDEDVNYAVLATEDDLSQPILAPQAKGLD